MSLARTKLGHGSGRASGKSSSRFFEIARVLVRLNHVCQLHRKRESRHCVNQTTARTSTEPPRNANVSDAMGGGVYVGETLA